MSSVQDTHKSRFVHGLIIIMLAVIIMNNLLLCVQPVHVMTVAFTAVGRTND